MIVTVFTNRPDEVILALNAAGFPWIIEVQTMLGAYGFAIKCEEDDAQCLHNVLTAAGLKRNEP